MRLVFLVVPAAVVGGALLGASVSATVAVAWSLTIGVVTAALVHAQESQRVRDLARRMNGWLGERHPASVALPGAAHWHELQVAVNAVGSAYERRGEKLRLERPWRRDLVDSLVGPALLFTGEGRLIVANEDAKRLFGLAVEESEQTLVQALGSSALATAARRALATGDRVEIEATVAERELRAVASVVGDEVLLVLTDQTGQRRIEEVRRDFVINASHELKTPATAIQTLTEALSVVAERDPGRVPEMAERLRSESDRLIRIVGELLDLRRLEDGGTAQREPVDLAHLCREVLANATPRADQRRVTLDLEAPDTATVVATPGDIRLIVENLVRNAVDYNREGGTVTTSIIRSAAGYELAVADTGIGIPQQDLARVFERFYRVDEDRSRETGGTGLGLSIVKHAVDRQGGSIRVDSLLGEGTTFVVRLPVEPRR